MLKEITKDKFILINEAFQLKEYDTVVQESCKIFEILMKRMYVEALGKFDSRSRKKLVEAEFSEDTNSNGIDSFTFGQVIGLYRKSDFFSMWGEQTGRDPAVLKSINFNLIAHLRNCSAHKVKGQAVDAHSAEYVYSHLKLFLALLGYTEYEKYISLFVEPKPAVEKGVTAEKHQAVLKRTKNIYNILDQEERRRLALQSQGDRAHDINIISQLVDRLDTFNTLDIGCNDGSSICDRLKDLPNRGEVVGVDSNRDIFSQPNTTQPFGIHYVHSDCESEMFIQDVRNVMEKNSIEGFEFVFVSMLLLHLKNPFKAIKSARSLMTESGIIFVRDIDDGLCVAHPDPKGIVDKMFDLSFRIPGTGYRHTGREIYTLLKNTGFRNVQLHDVVVDTVDMDFDERQLLFSTNFSDIKADLINAANSNSGEYDQELNWFLDAYEELEQLFVQDDFYYRQGDVVFTATKG